MKQCQAPHCNNSIFSHGYCVYHQNQRTDDKYISAQEKKREKQKWTQGFKTIKKSIKTKPKEATGEKILFETLFATRKHTSFISGLKIDDISHSNCAHVLAKGQNKYPKFKLLDRNIVFLTVLEHHLYDNGTIEQRQKYAEQMIKVGVVVNWKKLYDLRDELKNEYICDV